MPDAAALAAVAAFRQGMRNIAAGRETQAPAQIIAGQSDIMKQIIVHGLQPGQLPFREPVAQHPAERREGKGAVPKTCLLEGIVAHGITNCIYCLNIKT
jgi:hypothetical protein